MESGACAGVAIAEDETSLVPSLPVLVLVLIGIPGPGQGDKGGKRGSQRAWVAG